MLLDLPEDDWLTVMASLASTARGRKVRDTSLQDDAARLGKEIRAAIEATQTIQILGKPASIPEPSRPVELEVLAPVHQIEVKRGGIAGFFLELIAG